MLEVKDLKEILKDVIRSGVFPEVGSKLSASIVGYVQSNGKPLPPTISYTLGPASGSFWADLISKASSVGVSEYIISEVISKEFAGSSKVIPAPSGVVTVPMSFDQTVKVEDMSNFTDFDQVWEAISKAIIEFFKPEIV